MKTAIISGFFQANSHLQSYKKRTKFKHFERLSPLSFERTKLRKSSISSGCHRYSFERLSPLSFERFSPLTVAIIFLRFLFARLLCSMILTCSKSLTFPIRTATIVSAACFQALRCRRRRGRATCNNVGASVAENGTNSRRSLSYHFLTRSS